MCLPFLDVELPGRVGATSRIYKENLSYKRVEVTELVSSLCNLPSIGNVSVYFVSDQKSRTVLLQFAFASCPKYLHIYLLFALFRFCLT